ncbi:PIN domain-containing protein [Bacillus gobiensis]|uniref:PIN domain-containing protein n=1 Tax=Bacillus gobiensis TaxID=1441095 RepID=UPI003D195255
MEDWKAYFFQPIVIDELIKDSLVVVDTNVLLAAYQWREITVQEMIKALKTLAEQGRLKIPLQVIKEFSINRPREIVQLVNDIEHRLSSSSLQTPPDLNQIVPILEGTEIFEQVNNNFQLYRDNLKEFRNGLKQLRDELKGLFVDDPYLTSLKEIVEKSYLPLPENQSEEELIKKAQERFKEKRPPGYKDSGKEENNAGDYLIWHSILSLKENVIFVSGDKKNDWVYSDKHKTPISPRKELVEEFFIETAGKTFACITPKEFITLMNPDVNQEVQKDLSNERKILKFDKSSILTTTDIGRLVAKHLFDSSIEYGDDAFPYEHECWLISEKLNECSNPEEIMQLVFDILPLETEDIVDNKNFYKFINELHSLKNSKKSLPFLFKSTSKSSG